MSENNEFGMGLNFTPADATAFRMLADKDEEIARLRALVEEAYTEGWHDGNDVATEGATNTRAMCWEHSVARAALNRP